MNVEGRDRKKSCRGIEIRSKI